MEQVVRPLLGKPLCFFFTLLLLLRRTKAAHEGLSTRTSILFGTVGRSSYNFDVYTLPILGSHNNADEFKLTDGQSVNYNGHFPSPSANPFILSLLSSETLGTTPPLHLVYVTERNGSSSVYLDAVYFNGTDHSPRRSMLRVPDRDQVLLVGNRQSKGQISMKDRPSVVGDYLVYVSTHENSGVPRTSWAAVYSTQLTTGLTRRLTPYGVADFSPAVSPSGEWTAVASFGERRWGGEVDELNTDIYVFRTGDGSGRVMVAKQAGWPTWADESTLYFHRRGDDGWWSVYRATPLRSGVNNAYSVATHRVTPPGLHAFTPAASVANKSFIAVATRRPDSEFRHIELFNVITKEFKEVTRPVMPKAHHYNPFISPDSTRVGYHRCRGSSNKREGYHLLLENRQSPIPEISLFRVGGYYPTVSPEGDRIAYVNMPGMYVVNRDGSGLREILSENVMAFSTAWDPIRKGVLYTSIGPKFASESTKVDVMSISIDDEELGYIKLTTGGDNNAFPSPSPDGKWVVFRSGRSGHKNLYIIDAVDGEKAGMQRLTNGSWTDTMCNWSPDGEWIAFASDRENPGSGSFEVFMIHPNGTGLRKLVKSGSAGRANHPWFSPDGKYIVFTSDYAGVSAEPISYPHQFQPYGDIFIVGSDGNGIKRLTHNAYEDGTPSWIPTFIKPIDVKQPRNGPQCMFDDCHFLSQFPNLGVEVEPLASVKPQC